MLDHGVCSCLPSRPSWGQADALVSLASDRVPKVRFSWYHRDVLDRGWGEHLQLPKQNVLEQSFNEAIKEKVAGRSASSSTIHSQNE